MEIRNGYASIAIPVEKTVAEYLVSVRHLSVRTLEEYALELQRFATWCTENKVMLHEVNNKTVYQFLDHLKAHYRSVKLTVPEYSSSTLAGYVKVIKTFLTWCSKHEQLGCYIKDETLRQLKKPLIEQKVIQPFSSEDINALFEACDREESLMLQTRDKAILAVLLDTGIRSGELITLTLANICLDFDDPHIRVFGKGSKWGEIGLGDQARICLRQYVEVFRMPVLKQQVRDNPYLTASQKQQVKKQLLHNMTVFVSREGNALTRNGLNRIMTRLGDWAQVEDARCSTHTWRHTFAVNFMRQGGNIYTLSKLLRHSSLDVTEVYLRSLDQIEARKSAHSVLDTL